MKIATIEQMKAIDKSTINHFGVASLALMENAGRALAEYAATQTGSRFVIICGKGNNGGDGSVAARHLHNYGGDVTLMLLAKPTELSGDELINFKAAEKNGVKIIIGLDNNIINGCDIIIDALLGIGAKGAPLGNVKNAIEAINNADKIVVSADVPSGINANTGAVEGVCVRASATVTFGLGKPGLFLYPGTEYAGEIIVQDISLAKRAIENENITTFVTKHAIIPKRIENSHKGTYGKVLAVCGCKNYTGAAYLSALAALKAGCGVVTLGIPNCIYGVLAQKLTEVVFLPLEDENGTISQSCIPDLQRAIHRHDVIICGCGLGSSSGVKKAITHIIKTSKVPVVLDADGINAIADDINVLKEKKCELVVTPHLGEMSRLTGFDISSIQNNAVTVAKDFAREYNVIVAQKGANSIVVLPNGELYINTNGNSGMATAGSGDVLTGIIGAFSAQGLPLSQAVISGVFIHGMCGDFAAKQIGKYGMLASDILKSIPHILKEMSNTNEK